MDATPWRVFYGAKVWGIANQRTPALWAGSTTVRPHGAGTTTWRFHRMHIFPCMNFMVCAWISARAAAPPQAARLKLREWPWEREAGWCNGFEVNR